jgi:hypothetical protein
MDDDDWDIDTLPERLGQSDTDEALVRFIALQLVNGKTSEEVRRELNKNRPFDSHLPPHEWQSLMSKVEAVADDIKSLVIARAEMGDVEHQRLDSYARRSRAIRRLESIIDEAHEQADSVGKLNQVSFMVGGLLKAQESLDKFTGAQEAVPQVVVNLGYDPLEQFRTVVQRKIAESESKPAVLESGDVVDLESDEPADP